MACCWRVLKTGRSIDMSFRPLLAETITDFAALRYPVVISPKLDGIRSINLGYGLVSRKLKAIPNQYCHLLFSNDATKWFDGELICGDPTDPDAYNKTYRAVMSQEGEADVRYYVFDWVRDPNLGFTERITKLPMDLPPNCVKVEQRFVFGEEQLLAWEEKWLSEGYEGVMVRSPHGRYKYGRSTEKEGILLKLKRFVDEEFKVVGFEERMHNANEATIDELGHTKRSSHQENKVGRGDLGALILETQNGIQFNCGSGFNDEQRREIWDNREAYLGRFAKVKHFAYGVVDKPRFPVFLGFRDPIDMETPS